MSVSEDFATYLRGQAAISAIVGDKVRQAPMHVQTDPPYVCFRRRGRVEELTLGGEGGMIETELDVECRAKTLSEAENLADVVHGLLNGFKGNWGNREICGAFVSDQDDDYDFLPPGSNRAEKTSTLFVRVYSR